MIQKTNKPNRQVERTKSWIFDAIMLLIDEKPYNKISVSDICEKAGVARPTFYRNYDDKDDVLFEHLSNVFSTEMLNIEKSSKDDEQNTIVLAFNFKFMTKHQKNLKKIISITDIESHMIRNMEEYMMSLVDQYSKQLSAEEYLICRYKLCYQITGSLRVVVDWFIDNMPMPAKKLVSIINAMNVPKTIQYRNIPRIVVRFKDD